MKNLLFSSVGNINAVEHWIKGDPNFDIILYYYGDDSNTLSKFAALPNITKVVHRKGGKFNNFLAFYNNDPIAKNYENYFITDEDIYAVAHKLNKMFSIFEQYNLWAAQPSLSEDSDIHHFIMKNNKRSVLRYTDFIENSMFLFNKYALEKMLPMMPHFASSNVDGWCIDLILYQLLGQPKDKIAIIDEVVCRHPRKTRTPAEDEERKKQYNASFATAIQLVKQEELAKLNQFRTVEKSFKNLFYPIRVKK